MQDIMHSYHERLRRKLTTLEVTGKVICTSDIDFEYLRNKVEQNSNMVLSVRRCQRNKFYCECYIL